MFGTYNSIKVYFVFLYTKEKKGIWKKTGTLKKLFLYFHLKMVMFIPKIIVNRNPINIGYGFGYR